MHNKRKGAIVIDQLPFYIAGHGKEQLLLQPVRSYFRMCVQLLLINTIVLRLYALKLPAIEQGPYKRIRFCIEITLSQKKRYRNENGIFFHLRMGNLML